MTEFVPADSVGTMPPLGLTLEASVLAVTDGDTVKVVHGNLTVSVRLLECWAPELISGVPGIRSREALRHLLPVGSGCRVHVPFDEGEQVLSKLFSMGRILGRIYTPDGVDVSVSQVAGGFATATKVAR